VLGDREQAHLAALLKKFLLAHGDSSRSPEAATTG
jgi:hypothetical protein